jgi:hypothetical protein
MDKRLISGLFLKLLGYWLSQQSTNIVKKKFQFLKKKRKKKKKKRESKSRWPAERMCLSSVNLDVLTLELDTKVQFANF